jgi:hypothetical protein
MELLGTGLGLILRYFPVIRLEGLRKTTKTSITVAGGQESNLRPTEYEAGLLITRAFVM